MRNQKNTYEYQVMRALKRKYHLITLRGGKCQNCGYNKNLSAFEFHHKNPKTKKFQLDQRSLSNLSMKVIMEEFEKCELLCANCHREFHSPDLMIENVIKKITNFDDTKIKWIQINEEKRYNCSTCGCEISKWGEKCRDCFHKSQRRVNRPDLNILKKEIDEFGYEKTGRKYNVTGKTIKKWTQ
jgi:hypothetical protein